MDEPEGKADPLIQREIARPLTCKLYRPIVNHGFQTDHTTDAGVRTIPLYHARRERKCNVGEYNIGG